jgi:hypothetical protein
MANRTISLSPIGDLIRKKMIQDGIIFSNWIEKQLLEWNSDSRSIEKPEKPKVPWYYECNLCKQKGHHQSDCSMYNPIIEGVEEE